MNKDNLLSEYRILKQIREKIINLKKDEEATLERIIDILKIENENDKHTKDRPVAIWDDSSREFIK